MCAWECVTVCYYYLHSSSNILLVKKKVGQGESYEVKWFDFWSWSIVVGRVLTTEYPIKRDGDSNVCVHGGCSTSHGTTSSSHMVMDLMVWNWINVLNGFW